MPVIILPHDLPYHISKHSQQLTGLTSANGFVHSIKIHNKYDLKNYMHFHAIAMY